MEEPKEKIEWKISVPIFRSSIIVKQMAIAIGIPFGIVELVIGFASGKSVYTIYGLGFIFALFLLSWLFILLVYRGKYEAEFVLDDKGVFCRTQTKQAKKNGIVNGLTIMFGILSGKPIITGAGMLAQSRQEVFLRWKCITKVKYKPQNYTILLWGGWTEHIAIFCASEKYPQIEHEIILRTMHLKNE